MAAALEDLPYPTINTRQMASKLHSCPKCGTQVQMERSVMDAQRKVRELEAQIEMLTAKATAAGM